MILPRACHTATLLPNGRVLIAGGCTGESCVTTRESASAELYDPARKTFLGAAKMTAPRTGPSATLLRNGRVLLAGGWGISGLQRSAELYDPSTGRFVSTGSMTVPRGGHTATLLQDGRVLILGGDGQEGRLDSAEIYDPATREFAAAGRLGTPRAGHTATLLTDGRVLVAGGSRARGEVLASAEIYDPAKRGGSSVSSMSVPRHKHAAVALSSGKVLIVGGANERDGFGRYASTELFDPETGRFAPGATMSEKRFKIPDAVVPLLDGEVLVAGGGDRPEVADPAGESFRQVEGAIGAAFAFAVATRLPDGEVLITGGYDSRIRLTAGAWIYQPGRTSPGSAGTR